MWQRANRFVACTFFLLIALSAAPARAAPADAGAFIADLGRQAIQILQGGAETPQRKAAFAKLFTQDFDVPAIGKFVLGRYWNMSSREQQNQYIQLFGQYVVTIYAERFSNYSGEQFKVTGSRADDPATATVSSVIIRSDGGPPIHVDWQVAHEGDGFKITNVVVENLSMALTQRQEFASIIDRNGGNVGALIDMLRQKVQGS
jgi:phospholipid transport system substrate-binding protein